MGTQDYGKIKKEGWVQMQWPKKTKQDKTLKMILQLKWKPPVQWNHLKQSQISSVAWDRSQRPWLALIPQNQLQIRPSHTTDSCTEETVPKSNWYTLPFTRKQTKAGLHEAQKTQGLLFRFWFFYISDNTKHSYCTDVSEMVSSDSWFWTWLFWAHNYI